MSEKQELIRKMLQMQKDLLPKSSKEALILRITLRLRAGIHCRVFVNRIQTWRHNS